MVYKRPVSLMPFVLLFLPSLLPLAVLPFQQLGALGELPNASVVGGLDPSVQNDIMNTDFKALPAVFFIDGLDFGWDVGFRPHVLTDVLLAEGLWLARNIETQSKYLVLVEFSADGPVWLGLAWLGLAPSTDLGDATLTYHKCLLCASIGREKWSRMKSTPPLFSCSIAS